MGKTVYFDNNATSQIAPEVRDVMLPFLGELYGNPSSMHAFGGQVAKFVDRSREEVAAFLNCSPEEVIFTSCATESDNSAIRGTADWFGKDLKVITTAVEHPAVLQPVRRLKALGFETLELPVNGVGQIDLDQLAAEIDSAKAANRPPFSRSRRSPKSARRTARSSTPTRCRSQARSRWTSAGSLSTCLRCRATSSTRRRE